MGSISGVSFLSLLCTNALEKPEASKPAFREARRLRDAATIPWVIAMLAWVVVLVSHMNCDWNIAEVKEASIAVACVSTIISLALVCLFYSKVRALRQSERLTHFE